MCSSVIARLRAGWNRQQQRIVLLAALLLLVQHAQAELMLFPTRVVFEKNQRAAQVELINNGAEPTTYRISLVNRRMSESGEFLAIDTPGPGEQFANTMLHYSPRQITLAPGTAQTVRIMLRKPAELAEGEYRSHLQFEKLPESQGNTSIEAQAKASEGIGIVLNALVGASIPIIVRHGATAATVSLAHLELQNGGPAPLLALQFERTGNSSVYGDLDVSFTPQGGAAQLLARMGGVAVYAPNPLRQAKLPLQPPPGLSLAHGTLVVTYRERPEAGGAVLAQASLALP